MKYGIVALVFFLFSPFIFAQSTNATISGGVTDPSGNFIPNAAVEIANDATGLVYSATTNNSGMYLVPILPPGRYHVQVSKPGFKTIIKADLVLNVQSALALNFILPIGATSESVTVSASSAAINTADASVSTVIDRKFVENIPLNGRSLQDLISMTPGIVTQSPQNASQNLGFSGDFSVNGQRTESNYYIVDGISGNSGAGNGHGGPQAANAGALNISTALGTTQSLISVDALQEFRVQSSTYSAEYGRAPGGQFSIATRSGTNTIHGTIFDYLRNNYFDANDWFNDRYGIAQPALRQNDFGGTAGGPVWIPRIYDGRKRSFFFISHEGLRLTQPQAASLQYVPSTSLRQNAFGLQAILNAFPVPTAAEIQIPCDNDSYQCPSGSPVGTPVPSGLSPFTGASSLPARINSTSLRIDHSLSSKLTVFFRFGDTPSAGSARSLSALTKTHFDSRTYTAGAASQFSHRIYDDFRIGYSQAVSTLTTAIDSFGGASTINLPQAVGAGGSTYPYPVFEIFIPSIGAAALTATNSNNTNRQWNVVNTSSMSVAQHELKFGIDYRRINSPLNPASPLIEPFYETSQQVVQNQALEVILAKSIAATPIFNEFAAFAQDNWHITRRLSLSLGIRWDVDPPPHEAHGNDAYTLSGSFTNPVSLTLAARGTPLWKTTYYNFVPRLGLAWQAHTNPGWETVVRAGGGVFFDTDDQLATQGYSGIGFSAVNTLLGAALPVSQAQLNFSPSTSAPYTGSTVYAFPDHLQLPYTLQWNTSLQQALGRLQTFTLSYVGANGRRLIAEQELSLSALNPNFGYVIYIPNGETSNYQALQFQFQRSVHKGLQALASYTWSHSIDLGSTATALTLQRGNSDFDVRHNASAGLSWDLPGMSVDRLSNLLLSNWALDGHLIARTAYPVTLKGNLLSDPATGQKYYGGVNIVADHPLYLYGPQYPGGRSLNQAAFQAATGNNGQGDAPRNFARGFGEAQINIAVRREFLSHDRLSLQFRAEAFNVLNHPNFGEVDPALPDATFGQAQNMLNQSLPTLASQYQQGGPRSMQFALKAIF